MTYESLGLDEVIPAENTHWEKKELQEAAPLVEKEETDRTTKV